MIFCKNKRSPGIILIFTLFSLALLSMIFVYCLEDRGPREKFYSLAMKAGGFLDVKKNGKDLEVDVRGLLDLERWSMLNYLRACFYNLATDPKSYRWSFEEMSKGWAVGTFILNATGNHALSTNDDKYRFSLGRYGIVSIANLAGFMKIKDFVKSLFGGPLPIDYSNAVTNAKLVNKGDIVHNSNLKVEAKINFADNKLPFNEKFKKEALNALYECIETAYSTDLILKKKNPGTWEIDGITYSNNGAVEITNKVWGLIDDYNKKCPGYTLTFSDLMSIDELRLLIQGNFEDEVLNEYIWAKYAFKEKSAKELEALIRDTFVFHDIYAVNFLLANKFVQDAFIKVNIPTEFSSNSPMFVGLCKTVDYRLRNIGRNNPDKNIVTNTADSMYSFDGIESLSEADLVEFLKQEFYDDYMNVLKPKLKTEIPVPATTLNVLSNDQLALLVAAIIGGNPPNIDDAHRNQAMKKIKERTRLAIRKLLKLVLEGRYKLYYGGNGHGDARNVIKDRKLAGSGGGHFTLINDQKQFSEAFDYLALEGETGRLAKLNDRELKLVRGRKNDKKNGINKKNGIINMAIDEDDGIMNLQILKILCKKLSVFCAKDEKDQKLYLFPYPWDGDLINYDVGSICDISNNGIEYTTYYYDYLDDKGKHYDSNSRLEYEFDEKIGVMKPILSKHAKVDKDHHKHNLLLKEDVFTDRELGLNGRSVNSGNPWDRVRNFCSFSNYANVKLRIYDDSLKFIRKETDDVICFEVPNDMKLELFKKNSGGKYERGSDGKIKFISNGGFHIEPMLKNDYDKPH